MASTAGSSSPTDMGTPYADSRTRLLWVAAAIVGTGYGVFLIVTALRLPSGAELTGQFTLQPAVKALTAKTNHRRNAIVRQSADVARETECLNARRAKLKPESRLYDESALLAGYSRLQRRTIARAPA